MKQTLFTLLCMLPFITYAQGQEFPLWPNGVPTSNGLEGQEVIQEGDKVKDVSVPTLRLFQPKNPNGMVIIICPGGGYARLAMSHEGTDMAPWFNSLGITYLVLKYRMPNGHAQIPLADAQQAIKLVRSRAAQWKIDPSKVGIMGASAGGHFAATLATHFEAESRPDFQILLYPVITMDKTATHAGSRTNLLGPDPSPAAIQTYSNELHVTANTPPAFIALSSDDTSVPPPNSINYYLALWQHKVPVSLHIYPTGGHGWGYRSTFLYHKEWTSELEKWLNGL